MKKICPVCGGKQFFVSAHIVQGWLVDEDGGFMEVTEDCSEVVCEPDDYDLWECAACGYSAAGTDFNSVTNDGISGVYAKGKKFYQDRVFVYPVAHHYEEEDESPYIKFNCPVCETLGARHSLSDGVDSCPICGVNLAWE